MKIKNLSLALALLITFAGCEQKSTNDTDLVSAPKVDKTLQKTVDKQQEPTLVKKRFYSKNY
jgi:predicted small lipoprotein YifL